MSCSNAALIRYVVAVESMVTCGLSGVPDIDQAITDLGAFIGAGNRVLDTITKVGGLSLGEEGDVEVPYWDRTVQIPDGKRKLPNLTLQKRIQGGLIVSPTNDPEFDFIAKWFQAKNFVRMNIWVYITNRGWQVMYKYRYVESLLKSWKQEDQELGANKVGLIDVDASPDDIELWSCNNVIVSKGTAAASFAGLCSP